METIREYPATDTEAIQRPHGRKRQKEGIRLVQMYDGSFQLETGNSRTTLVDTKTSQSTTQLKKSPSIKNILKFKKSISSATLSQSSSPDRTACPRLQNGYGPKVFENGEMTMFLPKHHLSQEDLINQCDDLRMKYKNIVSRLPKKMRKKYEWSGADIRRYTSEHLIRLEIETRRLEDLIDQKIIKLWNAKFFIFFGLKIGI